MKLLEHRDWPNELKAELERQLDAASPDDIARAAEACPALQRGFRPGQANLPRFRRGLAAFACGNIPESSLDKLRWCTAWKDIVCVLSTRALTIGFDDLAAFLGGARLVLGMLFDPRDAVRAKALEFLDSGKPFSPVPDDPDAARRRLAETFAPFVRAFSAASVAPQVTHIDRSEADQEEIRRLRASLDDLRAQLSATAQARREAERAAGESARAARSAVDDAAHARADADAARDALSRAEAAQAAAESDSAALRDELLRCRNDLRTMASFKDECFRLRERETRLTADNEALRADAARARARADDLEAAARDTDAALLSAEIAKPLPEAPRATMRDLLAGMAYPGPFPAAARLRLVIDGHNVLNVSPEYVAMATDPTAPLSHEELRDDLQRRVVALAARLAPCDIDLHFDSPVKNLYRPAPCVRVCFSGGSGDHRADHAALDELAFFIQQGGAEFLTVTEDAGFAAEALRLGSRTVRSGDFARLLFSSSVPFPQ